MKLLAGRSDAVFNHGIVVFASSSGGASGGRRHDQAATRVDTTYGSQEKRLSRLLKRYQKQEMNTSNRRDDRISTSQHEGKNIRPEQQELSNPSHQQSFVEKEGDEMYTGIGKLSEDQRRVMRRTLVDRSFPELKVDASKKARYFYRDPETGLLQAAVGVHGDGREQWWALWVNPGREKQVTDTVQRMMIASTQQQGREIEQPVLECWVPSKKIRAWNPKTGKMGNKTLKFGEGGTAGVVLLRAMMDSQLYSILSGNVNVLGFQHREVFEEKEFPMPAPAEYISAIRTWEQDLSPLREEDVRRKLGLEIQEDYDVTDSSRTGDRFDRRGHHQDRRKHTAFRSSGEEVGRQGRRQGSIGGSDDTSKSKRAGRSAGKGQLSGFFEAEVDEWFGDTGSKVYSNESLFDGLDSSRGDWFEDESADDNAKDQGLFGDDLGGLSLDDSRSDGAGKPSGGDDERVYGQRDPGFSVNPNDLNEDWGGEWGGVADHADEIDLKDVFEDMDDQTANPSKAWKEKAVDSGSDDDLSWWDEVESAVPSTQSQPGEAVRVIDGRFKDFEGEIIGPSRKKGRVRVALDVFGMRTEVELDERELA